MSGNPFVMLLVILDTFAGLWYLWHNSPYLGWLWISYAVGNLLLLKIAEGLG